MHTPLMTIDELGIWLKMPKETLYQWVHLGRIPYIKVGRLVRFDPKAIERWLESTTMVGTGKR